MAILGGDYVLKILMARFSAYSRIILFIILIRVYVVQVMLCGHKDLMLNKMAFDKFSGLNHKGSLPELIKLPGNR